MRELKKNSNSFIQRLLNQDLRKLIIQAGFLLEQVCNLLHNFSLNLKKIEPEKNISDGIANPVQHKPVFNKYIYKSISYE
jgi:hypothetical protein